MPASNGYISLRMDTKVTRLPYNEFSEQFTADMASEESMWHYWLQPKYDEARKEWEKKITAKLTAKKDE